MNATTHAVKWTEANQALGLRSSKIMTSGEKKSVPHSLLPSILPSSFCLLPVCTGQRNLPKRLLVPPEIKKERRHDGRVLVKTDREYLLGCGQNRSSCVSSVRQTRSASLRSNVKIFRSDPGLVARNRRAKAFDGERCLKRAVIFLPFQTRWLLAECVLNSRSCPQ